MEDLNQTLTELQTRKSVLQSDVNAFCIDMKEYFDVEMPILLDKANGAGEDRNIITGNLKINESSKSIKWKNIPLKFTKIEYRLVLFLASQPDRTRSRYDIMRYVHDDKIIVSERTIDSHVKRIKAKLRGVDSLTKFGTKIMITRVGFGYIWRL